MHTQNHNADIGSAVLAVSFITNVFYIKTEKTQQSLTEYSVRFLKIQLLPRVHKAMYTGIHVTVR